MVRTVARTVVRIVVRIVVRTVVRIVKCVFESESVAPAGMWGE